MAHSVADKMEPKTTTLDVREDIRRGSEPFSRIMAAADALADGSELKIIAPFEPVPLFAVMAARGFSHEARPVGNGDWEVIFARTNLAVPFESKPQREMPCPGCGTLEVDARGLEPPQPMVAILEALSGLKAGGELRARTDRRPMHLYSQLELRGFVGETKEEPDGSFITHIRRA